MAELDADAVSGWFREFGNEVARLSPLYSRLSVGVAEDAALVGLLMGAPGGQRRPVMLFAAVHYLLLADRGAPLGAYYASIAPGGSPGDDPFPVFREYCLDHAEQVRDLVATRSVQTNEVGRCALFVPPMSIVANEIGALAHIDVGASAGLNTQLDRYAYRYEPGGDVGGPSPVTLTCGTRGPVPIVGALPPIVAAMGIDPNPIDVTDDEAVRWLEACVWPDQPDRFHRLVAAITLARDHGTDVRRGDALASIAPAVTELAEHGHPVVTTSWVMTYLDDADRSRFVATMDHLGTVVDLSWIIAEAPAQTPGLPVNASADEQRTMLTLVRWRHGTRHVDTVAVCHPHGAWLHWIR